MPTVLHPAEQPPSDRSPDFTARRTDGAALGVGSARPTDRLFFAVFPDEATAGRVAAVARQLRAELGLHGKVLREERLHVTLHHLGDHVGLPGALVQSACAAGCAIGGGPGFEVAFDRAGTLGKRRKNQPFVLRAGAGAAALAQFQQRLGAALHHVGLSEWVEERFVPHLTLLYDNRCMQAMPVDPLGWWVNEFRLVRSLLGQSRYICLARWSLQGPANSR